MTMKRLYVFALFLIIQSSAFAQLLTIDISEDRFRIDPFDHIIVIQAFDLDEYSDLSGFSEIELILAEFQYQFTSIPASLEYTDSYMVSDGVDDFDLFFTQLPLLKIQSSTVISSGSKIPGEFSYADNNQILNAPIGVNFQNSYLSNYPKRSYSLEFWTEPESEIPTDVQFGNMTSDDDWVLISMYHDPLRIRTLTAHKLWLAMHQPSYLAEEPGALSGTDAEYAEVFVNGHYSGIYLLSQQIEPDLLDIREFDGTIRGELFRGKEAQGATLFTGLPNFDNSLRFWAGHTMIYPLAEDTTNWQNIYDFTDFVLNSTDTEFQDVWSRFDYQNYLDHFIFLNLTRTADNTGKNVYMARLDEGSPYFYVPAQLNGSFGIKWDGTDLNVTNDILTNGFINRVIENDVNNYTADVNARWAELRGDILSIENLTQDITDSYNLLKANNIYAREALVYPNYPFNQESFDYLLTWLEERIAFLDPYFNYFPLSVSKKDRNDFIIYPNPVEENFRIQARENLIGEYFHIFDLQGQTVKSGLYNGEMISISDIESGFYILEIKNHSEKIVVR